MGLEDLLVVVVDGRVLDGVGRIGGLDHPHFPDVVGRSVGLVVLKEFWVLGDPGLAATSLGYSPTAIPNVPHSGFVWGHCAVFEFVGELAVVGMVLECGHIPVFLKEGSPLPSALLDHLSVILQ